MTRNQRGRRPDSVHLPLAFAPQVLPALQVAEWLTSRLDGRHRGTPKDVARRGGAKAETPGRR